ncbi:flagellar hook-associated protein 3 FlgL [Thermanaeromonas toyohensis ToBE]|uniref:Flagellar hook-associated protein 3 FlgL n=1 Tax=Thermanaeromonas toyohensis ToBE TaxID=698762 RepID=A0A1W1VL00_9FIRM|nr:flagellar hook-associated protein FlgL [Thermanaeromonas toyohensis]SMB93890.1 flagellar hook-associated protein 3 FlgL [Thermanaeromonas toyohensis ToBE]
MRVTNQMLINNLLTNINHNLEILSRTQKQLSSGKTVSRPSDDPIIVARVLAFKTALAEDEQYSKNMDDARGWLDASEGALNMATSTLQRAKELAVYGANGTLPQASREALAAEVDQLIDELIQTANTSYGGRYLFGGSYTTLPPFSRAGGIVVYNGDDKALEWEVAPQVTMAVNENGNKTFMQAVDSDGDGVPDKSIFQVLQDLYQALLDGNYPGLSKTLGELDQAIDHILNIRATLGAKSNRVRMAQERLFSAKASLTETMSKLEDIDLAETVMNYKNQENVYQAALATAAMILQPTLINYLR